MKQRKDAQDASSAPSPLTWQDLKIIILDLATGLEQYQTRWTYESPFLEMQHGLPMNGIEPLSYFNSVVAFVVAYRWFGGFTGTLGPAPARHFLQTVYGVETVEIPRNKPSRFYDLRPVLFAETEKGKWLEEISKQVKAYCERRLEPVQGSLLLLSL